MAQNIILKRSATPGKIPTTASLSLGELAINSYDGKAFIRQSGSIDQIITLLAITSGGFLNVTESLTLTGSLSGTSSYAITASYALTASYATTASISLATTENRVFVLNKSGAAITKGMVVHITGSNNSSDTPHIITASYENDNNSANTLGIASQTINTNQTGYVTTEGVLTGINVTGFVAGQVLYLGATGSIIGTAPIAPLHAVRLGQVVRDSPSNNGSIYVRIDNGYELGELHDVHDTSTTSSYGDILTKSGSIWINSKKLTGSYSLTGSINTTGSLFLIGQGTFTQTTPTAPELSDFFLIRNATTTFKVTAGAQITSSAQTPLTVVDNSLNTLLTVSQSGLIQVMAHATPPTASAPEGAFWFTNDDLYISLSN
jgi:hypothetical protein